jgi:hypothetical protein
MWHSPKDDVIGWDFFDLDNKPWDYGEDTRKYGICRLRQGFNRGFDRF